MPLTQFSLFALFLFLTVACLAIAWFSRVPRVRIVSYLLDADIVGFSNGEPSKESAGTIGPSLAQARALLQSDEFAKAVVSDPMIAQLAMIKDRPLPASWLQDQLHIEFPDAVGVPSISIVVPASQEQEGRLLIEQVIQEYRGRQLASSLAAKQQRRDDIAARLNEAHLTLTSKTQQLNGVSAERSSENPEAIRLHGELTALQNAVRDLSVQLETLDVEMMAPSHIRTISGTTTIPLGRW